MKRIQEIIEIIEITGDKCFILHKESSTYVVMKLEDYRKLVISENQQQASQIRQNTNIYRPQADIREFEIPEEDRFYTEPLEDE